MNYIKEEMEQDAQVFYFYGELDSSNSYLYKEKIVSNIERKKANIVIFDFTNTSFVDSAGIGLILGRYNELKSLRKNLRIRGVNMQLDKIFKIAGLYKILNIEYIDSKVKSK